MNREKSEKMYIDARKHMPGGVNSPVRAYRAVGQTPIFIDHAKGSHIYDVDGNNYIDYVCSWGPNILGAARDEVVEAVKKSCEKGLTFGAPTEKETQLAELIKKCYKPIEKLRLVNSGTEAVMSALRVARGYTGRDVIIKFEGNYHGHSDGMLVKAGSGLLTDQKLDSAGVPDSYAQTTAIAEYNNINSVKKIYDRYPNKIAGIIIEPVAANMGVVPPDEGFLRELKNITSSTGSLLIFDEVITGFRVSLGGAAKLYGIKPDLVTLGKIVGGGLPLAAYGGRADIMRFVSPEGAVYQAGTLSGNPIATAAGIATLKILIEDKTLYERLEEKSARLERAFAGIEGVTVNRVGSLMSVFFTDRPVKTYEDVQTADTDKYKKYFSYMLDNNIYIAPSQFEAMFVSDAHTDEDIEKTIEVIQRVFT